jgi:hypothetical protein
MKSLYLRIFVDLTVGLLKFILFATNSHGSTKSELHFDRFMPHSELPICGITKRLASLRSSLVFIRPARSLFLLSYALKNFDSVPWTVSRTTFIPWFCCLFISASPKVWIEGWIIFNLFLWDLFILTDREFGDINGVFNAIIIAFFWN